MSSGGLNMQLTCLVPLLLHTICVAASYAVLSLPGDRVATSGTDSSLICGSCCQGGSYCGQTDTIVSYNTITIPADIPMTCLLRDRSVPGAVDGGLCVPNIQSITPDSIQNFCLEYLKVSIYFIVCCREIVTVSCVASFRCAAAAHHSRSL